MKKTVEYFQQMTQERLNKVEEIKSCRKHSAVSLEMSIPALGLVCHLLVFNLPTQPWLHLFPVQTPEVEI